MEDGPGLEIHVEVDYCQTFDYAFMYISKLCLILLFCMFVLVSVTHCFDYCSCVVKLKFFSRSFWL